MNHMSSFNPDDYNYAAHAFVDKKIALPLQAADMMIWHVRHFFERAIDGHLEMRRDFLALTRPQDTHSIVEPKHLLAVREMYRNAHAIFGESLTDPNAKLPGLDVAEGIMRSFGVNPNLAREVRQMLAQQDR
jgi:hypothetical protein